MDNVKKELIQKIQTREEVFALFSRATRQPFVICDAESFNDQVWIFENQEDLEKAAQPIAAEKNAVAGIKVENKSFLNFYTTLYTLGVNSVVYHEKDKTTELELEEIVKKPDFSVLPEEKRPLLNPQLQLSAIYFMQEFRRDVEMEEKKSLPELEEEVAANVVKSKFLLAVEKKGEEEKNDLFMGCGKCGKKQVPFGSREKGRGRKKRTGSLCEKSKRRCFPACIYRRRGVSQI